jgi:transposase
MAAQSLQGSRSALGEFYRRMRSRLGAPKAITATAHKLARIIYHLLITREPYNEDVFARIEIGYQKRDREPTESAGASPGICARTSTSLKKVP